MTAPSRIIIRIGFSLLAGFAVKPALAQESPGDRDDLMDKYRYVIQRALEETKNIGKPCYDCGITMAGKSEPERQSQGMSPTCQATYKSIYDKPVVDMRVVFGYLDYKNDVEDRYQAAALIEEITKPCDGTTNTCGFSPAADDGELFEKRFQGVDGKWRTIRLTVVASSARDSERLNRGDFKQAQERKTRRAEEAFYGGLRSADVLLFAGHARSGGGLDFGPPRVNPKTKRTDHQWYRSNRENWERMKREVAASKGSHPKILGLFACDTDKHFGTELRQAMPDTGLLLTGPKAWFATALGHAFTTLDSVLNTRCESDFSNALATVKDIDDEPASPIRSTGLFRGGGGGASGASGGGVPPRPSGGAWGGDPNMGGNNSWGSPYPSSIRGGTRPGSYPLPPVKMTPVDPRAPQLSPYGIY